MTGRKDSATSNSAASTISNPHWKNLGRYVQFIIDVDILYCAPGTVAGYPPSAPNGGNSASEGSRCGHSPYPAGHLGSHNSFDPESTASSTSASLTNAVRLNVDGQPRTSWTIGTQLNRRTVLGAHAFYAEHATVLVW